MPTKQTTPAPTLDERAERAAAELAAVEDERHRIATEEAERQRAHESRYDAELVAGYLDGKRDLEQAVDDAQHALDRAIAEHPLTKAVSEFYVATALRHQAFSDYIGALGRQGRDVSGAHYPDQPVVGRHLAEAIENAAQRVAMEARGHAAAAVEHARANPEESK